MTTEGKTFEIGMSYVLMNSTLPFAYLRAIGTYIECSGLDDCSICANLFGENTCRQVQCQESTWIVIGINILQTIVKEISRNTTLTPGSLIHILRELQVASQEKNNGKFKESFSRFMECIEDIKIDFALEDVKSENEGNSMFRFISCYLEMLSHLLDYICASRARDWNIHLSSLQKMTPAIIMMDHIKYRRWIPVYLADMIELKNSDV